MYCKECGHEVNEGDFCSNCGANLIETANPKYAGFWIRFAASFIDGIIIGIPISVISSILGIFSIFSSTDVNTNVYKESLLILDLFLYIGTLMISVLYYAGMHASKWQGTLRKDDSRNKSNRFKWTENFFRAGPRTFFCYHPIEHSVHRLYNGSIYPKEAIIARYDC